jgi:hypothetical protein
MSGQNIKSESTKNKVLENTGTIIRDIGAIAAIFVALTAVA